MSALAPETAAVLAISMWQQLHLERLRATAGREETGSCVLILMSLPCLHTCPYHACMHVHNMYACMSIPCLHACPCHAYMHVLTMPTCLSLPYLHAHPCHACIHALTMPTCMPLPYLHAHPYHACMHVLTMPTYTSLPCLHAFLTMQRRSSQYSPHMLAQAVMSILRCW